MENKKPTNFTAAKKPLLLGVAAAVVAVVIVIVILVMGGKEESYRLIKIYELSGEAVVTRADIGEIDAYNNMVLNSGDAIYMKSGTMTLKLDDDKYIYVEENTKFELLATGNSADSQTTIHMQQGAITNEIQGELSKDSSYEVNTPNSNMAVRGTFFRVVIYEENGVLYTDVTVFEGEVETRLRYKDGTYSAETVSVGEGTMVIIYEDDTTTDYLMGVTQIAYADLPEAIQLLVKEHLGLPDGSGTSAKEEERTEDKENTSGENEADASEEPSDDAEASAQDDADASTQEEQDESETSSDESATTTTVYYTVTFTYDGATFGTQTVGEGSCAAQPLLMPAESGSWDFDFTTPITENTVIEWR